MTTVYLTLAILIGFGGVIWGADRFIDGAANIAYNLGVSPLIVGLSIVGFGTSAPEMLVSATAAFDGVPTIGIGNALGSNIANIGLVLGVTLLIAPIIVNSSTLVREFPVLFLVMAVSLYLLWDKFLSFSDGLILILGFILTLFGMAYLALQSKAANSAITEEFDPKMATPKAIAFFLIGLIVLLIGSKMLVWGATGIATLLGVSELIIGLTIVAIGTSLPELAAAVSSALKQQHDLAVGNILGSNVFNILAVLAMPGLIMPVAISPMVLQRDFSVMVLLSLLLLILVKFSQQGKISRSAGLGLLGIYIAYNFLLGYQAVQSSGI